jgi:SRSO17 transposase
MSFHPEFRQEPMLIFDESADAKKGNVSAGAGRQHNGRLGKVEMSQVGVFATLATPKVNTWIDGELYLPESWFEPKSKERRERVGIPKELTFQTKPELVWALVQRIQANNVPFAAVAMDDLYGRNNQLRQRLDEADIEYYGDVPFNTILYLDKPQVRYVKSKRGKRKRTILAKRRVHACDLLSSTEMERAQITLRPSERGMLKAEFSRCRVWTLAGDTARREWLLIRRNGKDVTYVLSNAAPESTLRTMAWRKSHRFFVERSNQDSKSELGWDEFQATKYRAWQHQLALTILASCFVADTRLDWMQRFENDSDLLVQYETDYLPLLSVANVRALLKAAMPLPQLSTSDAAELVIEHLVNRTRSRNSRLKSSGASSINEQLSRM